MANFRPIKKPGTGLERWKDEKTGKERRRTGWLIPRKIGKRGKTRSRKEKKRKKTGTRKIFFKRERVSFLSRSYKFWPAHISTPHCRHVPRTGFWNGASTLKQHFVLPKNGSKYYLKYTFLVFPVLGILGPGTSLVLLHQEIHLTLADAKAIGGDRWGQRRRQERGLIYTVNI